MRLTKVLLVGGLVAIASLAHAQPAQPRRLVGTQLSGHMDFDASNGNTVDVVTLSFGNADGRAEVSIDFVAQYRGRRPDAPPPVIDLVMTQLTAEDEHPNMALQVDGRPVNAIPRLRSRRSIVASIPFDEFVRLANASRIIEHAFGVDLEFGAAQLGMLRSVAQRWATR